MTTYPYQEILWLSCAAKRCCSIRTVRPTGGDIWRITTQLDVPPESFLRAIPAEPDEEDGVLLAPNRQPIHVALARRALKARQAPCVFLMPIRDDVARCGLGALRPLPCQAFPASGAAGTLRITEHLGCTCRAWSLGDVDRPAVALLLEREAAERELDRGIIQDWNRQIMSASNTIFSLAEFCRYLLDAYTSQNTKSTPRGAT